MIALLRGRDIDLDNAVFNPYRVGIKRPGCRCGEDFAGQVKGGTMAGADKLVFFFIPRDSAAEMGAAPRQGKKTAVSQTRQIKLAARNRGHRFG